LNFSPSINLSGTNRMEKSFHHYFNVIQKLHHYKNGCNPNNKCFVENDPVDNQTSMNALIIFVKILLALSVILFLGVLFFSYLKYLKRTYFPKWKFPDYISVGYAEYLYKKYIKRTVK
jgi:hypothetical protein